MICLMRHPVTVRQIEARPANTYSKTVWKRIGAAVLLWMALVSFPMLANAQDAGELKVLSDVAGLLHPFVGKDNSLQNRMRFDISDGKGNVTFNNVEFQSKVTLTKVEGDPDSTDVEVAISPVTATNVPAVMGVEFAFDHWSKSNYVLIPAYVYNGNRFKAIPMGWPGVIVDPADKGHDIAPIIPNGVPHLNINDGTSRLKNKLYNASTPALAFFSPELQKSFLLLIKPTHNYDVAIEESVDRKNASFALSAPNLNPFVISFRMTSFSSQFPVDLLAKFFRVRKALTGSNVFINTTPFGKVFALEETLHNTERWDDKMTYFRQGAQSELSQYFSGVQLGWIGGLIEEQPLLAAGSDLSAARSVQSIQTIMTHMQADTGLMYGVFKDGVLYSDDFRNNRKLPLLGMARKQGDALYFLLQNLMMMKNSAEYKSTQASLDPQAQKLADGLVNLWNNYHQFGQLIDVKTGEPVVYGSTAGASIIGGLALASDYFKKEEYLRVAEAAADFYYNRDLKNGYTTGGPGEALQCADSESAFGFLESLTALYEVTGDKKYLAWAENAAAYCSSWVTSYDFPFPPQSALGTAGAKATGSVWANTQNKHGAPDICNYSGDCLLKLYRATDDPSYLELLKDIAHNSVQYVSTAEKPLSSAMKPGYVCERVNISNWEGDQNVGGHIYGSSPWAEVAIMQTTTQVPGIYVDVKKSTLTVFDHLEASLVTGTNSDEISIRVKNPTIYDTTCTVFLDFDKSKPMGWNNYSKFHKIQLSANEEKVVTIQSMETSIPTKGNVK